MGCGSDPAPPPQMPAPAMMRPAGPPTQFAYRLPIVGAWRVHRTHYGATNDQAYALDLSIASNRSMRIGGRGGNTGYPAYGQTIVADGPGVILVAVDGIPDNVPGTVNKYDQHGNYVIIDHENGEFSLMAHFIPGSLKVRAGQRVTAGTPLGQCGNSGMSTEPHIHWQVMDNANPNLARGLAPRMQPYQRNGVMSAEIPQANDALIGP